MSRARRVVCTGAGVVSSLGSTLPQVWQRLQAGRSGFSFHPGFFPSDLPSSTVGLVAEFDPMDFVPFEQLLRMGRSTQLVVGAGLMAVREAGLGASLPVDAPVCLGTSFATVEQVTFESLRYAQDGVAGGPPVVARDLSTDLAQLLRTQAASETIVQGCSASLTAIGHGVDRIRSGAAQIVLAGGAEAPLVPSLARRLASVGWLADDQRGLVHTILRPFDQLRCGGVMAEGAGCVVLEELTHAQRRGVPILGEVVGWRSTRYGDGGMDAPETVEGQARALRGVFEQAGWESGSIDFVQLTGVGGRVADRMEVAAVEQTFDPRTRRACIGTVTSGFGHTFGASGVLQFIGVLLAMRHQAVPPIANHVAADLGCDLDFVALRARPWTVNRAVVLSSGLGGCHTAMGVCRINEGPSYVESV